MTNPLLKNVKVSGYVQAQAGMIKNPIGEQYSDIGVGVGGRLNYKNTYLDAKLKAGTALGAEVKLGHEFDLGKNISLDTYGTALYNRGPKEDFETGDIQHHEYNSTNAEPYVYHRQYEYKAEWHSGEKRMGVGAQIAYKAKNIKFGVGIEAGTRSTLADKNLRFQSPTTDLHIIEKDEFSGVEVRNDVHFSGKNVAKDIAKDGGYVTGTAFVDAKVAKNLNLFANGRLNQGIEAGVRWTF